MSCPLIIHFMQDGNPIAGCLYDIFDDTRSVINKMSDILRVLGSFRGLDKRYVAQALNDTGSGIPEAELYRIREEGLQIPDLSNNGITNAEKGLIILSSKGIEILNRNAAYHIYADIFTLDVCFQAFNSCSIYEFSSALGRIFNLGLNQTLREMPEFDLKTPVKMYDWQCFAKNFNETVDPLWNFCKSPKEDLVFWFTLT